MKSTSALIVHLLALCFLPSGVFAQEATTSSADTAQMDNATGFVIAEDGHGLTIKFDGKPFANYVIDDINKPYLWPIIGSTGKPMTRAFPMEDLPSEGEDQRDHVHHRGLTFGHESIDANDHGGGDSWHEWMTFGGLRLEPGNNPKSDERIKKVSFIKHREFTELVADADHAMVVEICDYLDPTGKRFLTEQRRMTFRNQANSRSIDVDQDFTASDGEVRFNDRKDAGLSIRVPVGIAMDTKQGGHIINSNGETDNDTWSKAAKWCDYHGPVEGEHLGIAFLNHPSSFRFPTRWHVRSYGLFTANPFASKSFDSSLPDVTTTLKPGEQLKLRHRLIFHSGDAAAAKIEEAWQQYSEEVK